MRCLALIACLTMFAQNVKAGTTSYFDVPFQSLEKPSIADYSFKFNSVGINDVVKDVVVFIDRVEVVSQKDDKKIVITLNLLDTWGDGVDLIDYLWLQAERVEIVTRNEKDFKIWDDYIQKIKKRLFLNREKERLMRQKYFTPSKVSPPSD